MAQVGTNAAPLGELRQLRSGECIFDDEAYGEVVENMMRYAGIYELGGRLRV